MSVLTPLEGPEIHDRWQSKHPKKVFGIDVNAVGCQGMQSLDMEDQFFHKIIFADLTSYGP